MKIYIIHYYVEPGEAGINSVHSTKEKAEKLLIALLEDAFAVELEQGDLTKADLKKKINAAVKDGFFEYPGDGCGPNPWYEITEEEVR